MAIVAAAAMAPAFGAGYYNMPTSLRQCLGVGFGPGYHAPMVLGPMWKARAAAQPVERVPAALAPPYGGFDAPAVWSDGPAVERWHGPMADPFQQLPAISDSIPTSAPSIAPATHGTGYVGDVDVIPSPAPVGR